MTTGEMRLRIFFLFILQTVIEIDSNIKHNLVACSCVSVFSLVARLAIFVVPLCMYSVMVYSVYCVYEALCAPCSFLCLLWKNCMAKRIRAMTKRRSKHCCCPFSYSFRFPFRYIFVHFAYIRHLLFSIVSVQSVLTQKNLLWLWIKKKSTHTHTHHLTHTNEKS